MSGTDTDLDLDLKFAAGEDEQAPGEAPADGKYPGVAWGLADTGLDSDSDVEAARSN